MGQVYRARDTRLDRDVAIKILPEAFAHDTERLARFTREAKTLAALALVDTPAGEREIHIVPTPPATGNWTVARGAQPVWRADGKELFYLEPDLTLASIEVTTAPSLQVGLPRPLFTANIDNLQANASNTYEVSPDGQRFLIRVPVEASAAPMNVIMNWWAALED